MKRSKIILLAIILLPACRSEQTISTDKQPRPVSVLKLRATVGPQQQRATGVANPWKTEEIGFEVGGRIESVIEPDKDISGQVVAPDGELIVAGTELARIEDEKFLLERTSAEAQVEMAERQVEATKVEIEQLIPADIAAAEAEVKLAKTNFDRVRNLQKQDAISDSEVDQARANQDTAIARRAQLDAKRSAAQAQLKSNEAQVQQAKQSLANAERELKDTTLVSSIPGQTAAVHVVQGSVVTAGQPVVTVQMMDPIKIEVEVSASQSRELQYRDILPTYLTDRNGDIQSLPGFVYMIDTSADPLMRTFTLTLLLRNEKTRLPLPDGFNESEIARTTDLWRVDFDFLPGTKKQSMYIEERSIYSDNEGDFIWKAKNRQVDERLTDENRMLQVKKIYVKLGESRVPFLGNWIFREFLPVEAGSIDPATDLFVGAITVNQGKPAEFNGSTILLDDERWLLRPGDLVQIDMSKNVDSSPGLFVPIDTIIDDAGRKYVFTVAGDVGDVAVARRVEVRLATPDSLGSSGSMVRIEPVDDRSLTEGGQIIDRGVHFLRDGEKVLIHALSQTSSE